MHRATLYACVVLFGGTIVPTYSIVTAHVNDTVGKTQFVAASGGLLLLQGIGAAVGPVIGGFAMSSWRQGLGYMLVVTQAMIAVWGLYRLTRRAASQDRKGTFHVEPPVPVANTLAPAGTN
jgi:MFS family permease